MKAEDGPGLNKESPEQSKKVSDCKKGFGASHNIFLYGVLIVVLGVYFALAASKYFGDKGGPKPNTPVLISSQTPKPNPPSPPKEKSAKPIPPEAKPAPEKTPGEATATPPPRAPRGEPAQAKAMEGTPRIIPSSEGKTASQKKTEKAPGTTPPSYFDGEGRPVHKISIQGKSLELIFANYGVLDMLHRNEKLELWNDLGDTVERFPTALNGKARAAIAKSALDTKYLFELYRMDKKLRILCRLKSDFAPDVQKYLDSGCIKIYVGVGGKISCKDNNK